MELLDRVYYIKLLPMVYVSSNFILTANDNFNNFIYLLAIVSLLMIDQYYNYQYEMKYNKEYFVIYFLLLILYPPINLYSPSLLFEFNWLIIILFISRPLITISEARDIDFQQSNLLINMILCIFTGTSLFINYDPYTIFDIHNLEWMLFYLFFLVFLIILIFASFKLDKQVKEAKLKNTTKPMESQIPE